MSLSTLNFIDYIHKDTYLLTLLFTHTTNRYTDILTHLLFFCISLAFALAFSHLYNRSSSIVVLSFCYGSITTDETELKNDNKNWKHIYITYIHTHALSKRENNKIRRTKKTETAIHEALLKKSN